MVKLFQHKSIVKFKPDDWTNIAETSEERDPITERISHRFSDGIN